MPCECWSPGQVNLDGRPLEAILPPSSQVWDSKSPIFTLARQRELLHRPYRWKCWLHE